MALLSLASFRTDFPEFDEVSDALVTSKLNSAAGSIDETVWGDKATEGHGWLTAHLLTSSGYGRRTSDDKANTTYGSRYAELTKLVGRSYRLVLD